MTLELLEAIEARSDVTQRHLADRLGVALGLANSYLKRCARKGLIKVHQAPANRYLYYLTPQGFAEKARLTGEYLTSSLDFYRRAGNSMTAIFALCARRGYTTVCLAGISELAEIASVRAQDYPLEILAVFDPEADKQAFIGRPVCPTLAGLPAADACVFTHLRPAPALYEQLCARWPAERVLVPDLLAALVHTGAGDEPAGAV